MARLTDLSYIVNRKVAIWSSSRSFHASRPVLSTGLEVKTQHFAPETNLTPYPFMQIERDIRGFGANPDKEYAPTVSVTADGTYNLNGTVYKSPMTTAPATIYDPKDHSLFICPIIETPGVKNLYTTKEDSLKGWDRATSLYLRDLRNHERVASVGNLLEVSYFGGCLSTSPMQMYLDSDDRLPPPVSFNNDGKPPLSILQTVNFDNMNWLNNSEDDDVNVNIVGTTSLSGNVGFIHGDVANLAVTLKARTLDPEFLSTFDIDNSYRAHENMWFLHIWLSLRWMRMRPTPYYAQLQEVMFQFMIREAQIANRRFGIVSLKFSNHNLNTLQQEIADMFNEFDKALTLSLAGDNHLWYHVLYHHIYRVAESRPVPATVTFKPKAATHFPIQLDKPVDRAHMNNLIQYIHDYLYTYAAMPSEHVRGAYKSMMTLPTFPKRVTEGELLGEITPEEMDIFSRYIQHPSPQERGDEYMNSKSRQLRVALNTIEPSFDPISEQQYDQDNSTTEMMLRVSADLGEVREKTVISDFSDTLEKKNKE